MKKIHVLLIVSFVVALSSVAVAEEPRIVETEQGVVVEYTGTPSEQKTEEPPPVAVPAPSPVVVTPEPEPETKRVPKSLDGIVKIEHFDVAVIERSYGTTTFSFKIEVENEGPAGAFLADIIGEDSRGFELVRSMLTSRIGSSQDRTFTQTRGVDNNLASRITRWRLDDIRMSYPRN